MQKPSVLILFLGLLASGISHGKTSGNKNNPGIYGSVMLDSIWRPVVYLSLIPNMNERYTMSSSYIVDKANLDENGRFFFSSEFLPKDDALYRIHLSKNTDPPATLIIGGAYENFQFFITNKNQHIEIKSIKASGLVSDFTISGYAPNNAIRTINAWSRFADSTFYAENPFNKDLIENAIAEKMRLYADTSRHALASLYALYHTDFDQNKRVNMEFYNRYLEKWSGEKSEYFTVFRSHFKREPNVNYLLIGAAILGGFLLGFLIFRKSKPNQSSAISELSVQEKKIYKLLEEGLSNKEISEHHNIGINTVKTHVSSILAKLNMKSRKEIMKS